MSKQNIPTVEEISKLPRWAIVAFAARCARRAESLFSTAAVEERFRIAISDAITIAERSAASPPNQLLGQAAREAAQGAYQAAHDLRMAPISEAEPAHALARAAAEAARDAAHAAAEAARGAAQAAA